MADKITIPQLQEMKRDSKKVVGIVAWDYQIARIADRAGVDIISVGDSVGVNLWGQTDPLEITMDQMLIVAQAVSKGTERALLSCDLPYGPAQKGPEATVQSSLRMVAEAGVDMIKLDAAAEFPEAVTAIAQAGVPVWAQFGITPHTASQYGVEYSALSEAIVSPNMTGRLVKEARMLEDAGAVMLDFTNSGPVVGPAVTAAVKIPVIGGLGGGPWLDGRVRMAHAAIGYAIKHLDEDIETYANVAQNTFDAITALSEDIRAARQIKGAASRR